MAETYTPMMQQYLKVKEGYKDTLLFYRIGDFYEMFFDDAKIASRELDLVLTGKNAGVSEKVPMCGVPHHAVKSYIERLVNRGYKVAIVEQMQDPKEAKGIVERDVIRVITPGTVIDEIEDEKDSVYLCAIEDFGYGYALALVEVSTGENFIQEISHNFTTLLQTLLRNNVREVVLNDHFDEKTIRLLREANIVISYCSVDEIKEEYKELAESLTKDQYRTVYGRMLNYLEETQKQSKGDTLWSFLDVCKSAMGSRLLKKWIEKPLVKQNEIEDRYRKVDFLIQNFMVRDKMREHLSGIYDLQRLIARCALNSASPIDALRLSKTLVEVPEIIQAVESDEFKEYTKVDTLNDLRDLLNGAIVDNPPSTLSDGGVFKDGYNKELDEARSIQKNGRAFIASLESKERERTGIKTLKIGYNRVFGYYIEISKAAAALVQDEWGYVRKQTLVNNERFISQELKEKEDAILHAEENAIRIEKQLFQNILDEIKKRLPKLQKLALVLSELDCYGALAEVSSKYGYVRPTFTDDEFYIKAGKHPILDVMMKDPHYVANDIHMNKDESILLITGPNMGGKSTYMRQTALIVIMAQMGCFVPAKECHMPLFDKIFTRIGASDDILSGQSAFMVEMNEANRALQSATSRSLILFEEIGRGTSTYDGMALAQAMIEYIATCVHAKTLFSTHYHELTTLVESIGVVRNEHVMVKEDNNKVTFLYKIKAGSADRSYGINVARLAGLPEAVLDRAANLQKELESKKRVVQQSYQLIEMEKEDPISKDIMEKLSEVDVDDLSPREAWQMLLDLSAKAKEKK